MRHKRRLGPPATSDSTWLVEDFHRRCEPLCISIGVTEGPVVSRNARDHVIADLALHVRNVRRSDQAFATFEVRIDGPGGDTRAARDLCNSNSRFPALIYEFEGGCKNRSLCR
jgi:hypothetical protein